MTRALSVAIVVVAAALISACSTFAGPAWQVNDVSMGVDDFYAAFEASQDSSSSSTSTTTGRLETAELAAFMTNEIQEELLAQGLAEKGIQVTDEDRDNAELALQNQSQQSPTGAPAPTPTEDQIEIQAGIAALGRTLATEGAESGIVDIDAAARELYETNKEQLITPGETCAHFILLPAGDIVNATAAPTEADYAAALAEAEVALTRLATEDFAVVSADVSVIEEQLPGGDFGCQGIDAFPTEVQPIVEALAPGVLSAPTRIEGGYLIARVDSRTEDSEPPPFEQVEDQAREAVLAQLGQRLVGEWLLERSRSASVSVDPRFGTWDAENASVVPPEGAATPTVPTSAPLGLDPSGIEGLSGLDPSQLSPTGP